MRRGTGIDPLNPGTILAALVLMAVIIASVFSVDAEDGFLPNAAAREILSAVPDDTGASARKGIVILTEALPHGQPDPGQQKAFGMLYTFSPQVVFVFRDEPTSFSFWNLQADENDDFMLASPTGQMLMKMALPELKKTAVTLTFHKEGLYTFYCTMHRPEMTGQIYVIAPPGR